MFGPPLEEPELTRVAGCAVVSFAHMHWYRSLSVLASSAGGKTTCYFRIFASLLSGTVASTSLPLLVLGGMMAMRAEAEDGEGVEAADEWEELCFGLKEEDDGGS